MNFQELKDFLDEKANLYNPIDFIENDPIQIPHRFSLLQDIEIASFLTATISWGTRKSIISDAEKIMWLWLLALNPLSPYRLRWWGQGLRAREPVTWRRRLRAAGLAPDSLTQGVGPVWDIAPDARLQDGVGLRAAFLLRAEKRRLPMTPLRKPRPLALQAGTTA